MRHSVENKLNLAQSRLKLIDAASLRSRLALASNIPAILHQVKV